MILLTALLLTALEVHGLVGQDGISVQGTPALTHHGGTLFLATSGTFPRGEAWVFRFQGMGLAQSSRGSLPGTFAGVQVVTPETWFPETLLLWQRETLASGAWHQDQVWATVQEASVEFRQGALSWELGRFPVALGLNPWFSVLDPFRLQPRLGPFLGYSGVDGVQWTLRTASTETRAFWIPARLDTLRGGLVSRWYLAGMDLVGQVLWTHHEMHGGLGIQGNLLEGVLRVEGNVLRDLRGEEGSSGADHHLAVQISYSRTWAPGTGEVLFLLSDDDRYLPSPSDDTYRWMFLWTTEQERWGGFVGLDFGRWTRSMAAEVHYWLTPSVRVGAQGAYGRWASAPPVRWTHASLVFSWYP